VAFRHWSKKKLATTIKRLLLIWVKEQRPK
jgi:hypothetical protein